MLIKLVTIHKSLDYGLACKNINDGALIPCNQYPDFNIMSQKY